MSPVDQHGTEDQTHGRYWWSPSHTDRHGDRPMIHRRRTMQIAPGRQADAVARAHESAAIFKEAAGVTVRVSVVTTGTLGRLCFSSDYENMGAREAAVAKVQADPRQDAFNARHEQELRDGTSMFVPGTTHDEYLRDA